MWYEREYGNQYKADEWLHNCDRPALKTEVAMHQSLTAQI